jgi:hypothetical protein
MNKKMLTINTVIFFVLSTLIGCGNISTVTQTEFMTVTGPITTQTIIATGPITTVNHTSTLTGSTTTATQTVVSTYTVTVSGPTTTLTTTKTGIVTQGVTYISKFTPASPATLHFNDWVQIMAEYIISDPNGAVIWAIPTTNGKDTPNAGYAMAQPTAGRGSVALSFTIASGAVKVDQIHILMRSTDRTAILFEAYIPVDYTFGP